MLLRLFSYFVIHFLKNEIFGMYNCKIRRNYLQCLLVYFAFVRCAVPAVTSSLTPEERNALAYKFLATKSAYFKRPVTSFYDAILWNSTTVPQNYVPFHVDALYRHGTRFPSKKKLEVMKSTLLKLQKFDSWHMLSESLSHWDEHFPNHRNYTLHENGWNEHSYLAESLLLNTHQVFVDAFKKSERSFAVLSSPKLRVLGSAHAFLAKLSCLLDTSGMGKQPVKDDKCGKYEERKILKESNIIDPQNETVTYGRIPVYINPHLLRPFDHCSKYDYVVKTKEAAEFQFRKFLISSTFSNLTKLTSRHFDEPLTYSDVLSLYHLCTFELSLFHESTICNLFTKENLQVLEYAADLKHYYKTGYGYDINFHLACNLLQDILSRLDNAVEKFKSAKASSVVLRFGHAETLIPLLCLLNLYKDDIPLTAENYNLHKNSRLFRTGTFSPFAGNIIFVLYRPISGSDLPVKLAVASNGYLLKLSITNDCHICDYNILRTEFYSILENLNCDKVCDVSHDEL